MSSELAEVFKILGAIAIGIVAGWWADRRAKTIAHIAREGQREEIGSRRETSLERLAHEANVELIEDLLTDRRELRTRVEELEGLVDELRTGLRQAEKKINEGH